MSRVSSIAYSFERLVAQAPQLPAIHDGERSHSRIEILEQSASVGNSLRGAGLGEGAVVAVQMRNSAALIAAYLAGFRERFVLVPVDRDAKPAELKTTIDSFGVEAIVIQPDGHVKIERVGNRGAAPVPAGTALIKLTSGSSGYPRGVATSEANLKADCESISSTMGIGSDDVNLGAIPLSHSYGFSNVVMPLFLQGTAAVLSNDYMPHSVLDLSNRGGCTVVPGIPLMFDHLSALPVGEGDFRTVRVFLSAGAPLKPATSRAFRHRFGIDIHTFYGASECGGIAYDRNGGAVEAGSVGTAMEGVELSFDREGVLEVTSPAVALGYIGASEEESSRFHDGMFRTGDYAELDADGRLRLLGRVGDLINVAGRKVNPREVERIVCELDGVRDCRVFGVEAGARGEVVAAAVVTTGSVSVRDVRRWCAARLSRHKVPRVVKLIDSIPVDERGKIRKSELLALD
ncbi:MAG: acyl--CoA ligase [Acidobacteria bacterium]|nr:acyl--CoA ligase [Acidobacteriota bacterium]